MALVKRNLNGNDVEYDNNEFEILTNVHNEKFLHYIGNGENIHNPKGNTSCYAMFCNFKGASLDLSNFNTYNIINMGSMFHDCSNLESLNLENFDTHNVADMSYMFSFCQKLKHLSLSKFKTNNVINMEGMFGKCENLRTLNLSNFNTEAVTNMCEMFANCISLKTLNLLNFNVKNVVDVSGMFWNCKDLKELDLSSFNIYDAKDLSHFNDKFYKCENLEKLKVNSDCLQFFLEHKKTLFENYGNVNIIPVSKLDKAVENLFY